jgi:hypothetical protein
MEGAHAVTTPVENYSMVKAEAFDMERAAPKELREFTERRGLYQSIVGSVMWCAVSTRETGVIPEFFAICPTKFGTCP